MQIRKGDVKLDNYFHYYWSLLNKIISKNVELISMKEDMYRITGIKFDDMPKGGLGKDITDQIHKIVEKEKELKMLINKKDEYRRVYENKISRLSNIKCQIILSLYYLDRCSIKEIASILEISISYVKKLKRIGSDEFLLKNNDIS